jgi:hypothetical protein
MPEHDFIKPGVTPVGYKPLRAAPVLYAERLATQRGLPEPKHKPSGYASDARPEAAAWQAVVDEAEEATIEALQRGDIVAIPMGDDKKPRGDGIELAMWFADGAEALLYTEKASGALLATEYRDYLVASGVEGCELFVKSDELQAWLAGKSKSKISGLQFVSHGPKPSTLERRKDAYERVEAALDALVGKDPVDRANKKRIEAIRHAASYSRGEWKVEALTRADRYHRAWLKGQKGKK